MAQPTITVKDASGTSQVIFSQNPNGATTKDNCQPVVLATDAPIITYDNSFFNEVTTLLAGAGVFTGSTRDNTGVSGFSSPWVMFRTFILADQAGTYRIEMSDNGTVWYRGSVDTAVVANTPIVFSIPVTTRYYRVIFTNGATLQTIFKVNTSFTS